MIEEPSFDRKYFHSEVFKLREAFGTITFWSNFDNAQRARKALSFVFLRVNNATDYDQILLEATLDELARREILVLLSKPIDN